MANAGHTSPGGIRPGYTLLPDGRGQFVTRELLSQGEDAIRANRAVAWGSEAKDVERIDVANARLAHLAGLRLVDGQRIEGGVDRSWYWVRIYETQSATGETQIGGPRLVNDEDGRDQIELTYRQFVKETDGTTLIPYVKGTKGSAAPGFPNTSLASESMTDNGAWRMITRRYDQTNATPSTADELGPIVIRYPFNQVGDAAHAVAAQWFRQPATAYAPLTLNSSRVVSVGGASQTLFYVGDIVSPRRQGSTIVEFIREWANKPSSRSEWGTVAASFPGLRRTQAEFNTSGQINLRSGFSRTVICRIDFAYFRIAASGGDYTSPDQIPLIAETVYRRASQGANERLSPFEVYLSDNNNINPLGANSGIPLSGFFAYSDLLTVPTRTQYFALGAYGVVLECRIRRYMGNFYERRTVRVSPI